MAASAWDHFLPGHTQAWKGNLDVAIREYELALDIQRDHFNAMCFLAHRLMHINPPNLGRAEGLLTGGLAMQPNNWVALRWRAACRERLRDFVGAERDLQSMVKLGPEAKLHEPRIRLFLLYCRTGQNAKQNEMLDELGGLQSLLDMYITAFGATPEKARSDIAHNLVRHPNCTRDFAVESIRIVKEAVELSPKNWEFWTNLGLAQYRVEDWLAASQSFEKSKQLLPGKGVYPPNEFYLAVAYCRLGQPERARCVYDACLEEMLDPGDHETSRPLHWYEEKEKEDSQHDAEIALGIKKD